MSNKQRLVSKGCALAVLACAAFGGGAALAQPASGSGVDQNYQIGPGDTVEVFIWRQPELTTTVPVRPDGMISTPLVEDMPAVGKTPTQLARDIETVLSEYIRTPQVTVIVEDFVGTFSAQIRVLGEVVNPGPVPYRDRMTLLDVLLEVGGLTEFAAGNRSRLVRTVDGSSERQRVRIGDLLNDGDLDENVVMRPGDVVVVPGAIF